MSLKNLDNNTIKAKSTYETHLLVKLFAHLFYLRFEFRGNRFAIHQRALKGQSPELEKSGL